MDRCISPHNKKLLPSSAVALNALFLICTCVGCLQSLDARRSESTQGPQVVRQTSRQSGRAVVFGRILTERFGDASSKVGSGENCVKRVHLTAWSRNNTEHDHWVKANSDGFFLLKDVPGNWGYRLVEVEIHNPNTRLSINMPARPQPHRSVLNLGTFSWIDQREGTPRWHWTGLDSYATDDVLVQIAQRALAGTRWEALLALKSRSATDRSAAVRFE